MNTLEWKNKSKKTELRNSEILLICNFRVNWVLKTKTSIYEISRMLFYNTDYNFAHFANFNFAHFEIEEVLG